MYSSQASLHDVRVYDIGPGILDNLDVRVRMRARHVMKARVEIKKSTPDEMAIVKARPDLKVE